MFCINWYQQKNRCYLLLPFYFVACIHSSSVCLAIDAFTAMAISFPILENCFAILSQRANMVDFRTSNMRPMYPPD